MSKINSFFYQYYIPINILKFYLMYLFDLSWKRARNQRVKNERNVHRVMKRKNVLHICNICASILRSIVKNVSSEKFQIVERNLLTLSPYVLNVHLSLNVP